MNKLLLSLAMVSMTLGAATPDPAKKECCKTKVPCCSEKCCKATDHCCKGEVKAACAKVCPPESDTKMPKSH